MTTLILSTIGLLSPSAIAASAYNAHGFTLTPGTTDTRDLLTVWGTERQGRRECGVEGLLEYANQPLVQSTRSTEGWDSELLLADMAGINLGATCGVTDRIGVAASAPLWFTTSSSEGRDGLALGDARVSAPIGLVLPDADGGLGLSVIPFLSAPTAMGNDYVGSGGLAGGADLALGWTGGRLSVTGNAGVERTPEVYLDNLRGGTFLRVGLGGAVDLTPDLAVRLEGTLQSTLGADVVPWTETPGQVLASVRGMTDAHLVWTVGGAMGVTQGAGAANYRVFAGLGKTWGHEPRPEEPRALTQLRVIALDPDGAPVDAYVQFMKSPTPRAALDLGADGQELLSADPGDYKLHVSYGDYVSKVVQEDVPEGELTTITVTFEAPALARAPNPCEERLTLNSVHFAFNDDRPTADSIPVLIDVGIALARCPLIPVIVGGHTDAAGEDLYNLDLSQRRMNNVADILVAAGVDRARLSPVGYGETQLLVAVPTAEACAVPDSADQDEIVNSPQGRCAKNRRVEFTPILPAKVASSR